MRFDRVLQVAAAPGLAALAALAVLRSQPNIALQLALFAAVATMTRALAPRSGRRMDAGLALTAAVMLNAFGFAYDLFEIVASYDEVAHGFTLFAIAYAIGVALPDAFARAPMLAAALTAGTSLGLGALWEILEWTASALAVDLHMDVDDTLSDLLFGGAGALLGAWLALAPTPRRRRFRGEDSRTASTPELLDQRAP